MCKKIIGGNKTNGTYYEVLLVDKIDDSLYRYGTTFDTRRNIEDILKLGWNQTIQKTANYLQPYNTDNFKISYIEEAIIKGKSVQNALNEILMLSRSGLNDAEQNNPIPKISIEKEYRDTDGNVQIYKDSIAVSNIIPII